MMFDLTGMTALVTGASGGLGSSIARALSAQGARLALSGSNVDKLGPTFDDIVVNSVTVAIVIGKDYAESVAA